MRCPLCRGTLERLLVAAPTAPMLRCDVNKTHWLTWSEYKQYVQGVNVDKIVTKMRENERSNISFLSIIESTADVAKQR